MKTGFVAVFFVIFMLSYSFTNVLAQTVQVETVAEDLEIPWAIAFSPDGRIFVTERVDKLRVMADGVINPDPLKIFDVEFGECGL